MGLRKVIPTRGNGLCRGAVPRQWVLLVRVEKRQCGCKYRMLRERLSPVRRLERLGMASLHMQVL